MIPQAVITERAVVKKRLDQSQRGRPSIILGSRRIKAKGAVPMAAAARRIRKRRCLRGSSMKASFYRSKHRQEIESADGADRKEKEEEESADYTDGEDFRIRKERRRVIHKSKRKKPFSFLNL